MHVNIYVYIYMYIYIYIYIYIYSHKHTHAHTYTRAHGHTHTHTHIPCIPPDQMLLCVGMRMHATTYTQKIPICTQSRPTHKQKTMVYPKDKTYSQNRPISTFACVFVRSRKSSGFCEQTCECSKTACAIFRQTCTWTQTHRQTQTVMLD